MFSFQCASSRLSLARSHRISKKKRKTKMKIKDEQTNTTKPTVFFTAFRVCSDLVLVSFFYVCVFLCVCEWVPSFVSFVLFWFVIFFSGFALGLRFALCGAPFFFLYFSLSLVVPMLRNCKLNHFHLTIIMYHNTSFRNSAFLSFVLYGSINLSMRLIPSRIGSIILVFFDFFPILRWYSDVP